MKHAFWDRLLIVLCTLLLLGLAALVVGLMVGFIPSSAVIDQVNQLMESRTTRIIFGIVAAGLAVLALLVFWIVLPNRRKRRSAFAVQQTEHGTLKISVNALAHLVEKCIAQHPELTTVSSSIFSNEENIRVDLRVTLQSDINIPLAIASLQKQIKQYIEACSGVDVDSVRVVVEATVAPLPGTNSPFAIPDMLQPHLPKLTESATPASIMEPARILEPMIENTPASEEETDWLRSKPVQEEEIAPEASVQEQPSTEWTFTPASEWVDEHEESDMDTDIDMEEEKPVIPDDAEEDEQQ